MQPPDELEELRVGLERIRTLLENLAVRGLRACGPEELDQIASYAQHLEQTGAGHLAAALTDLQGQMERDERTSALALLQAQTNVRLLERLLTLRVVKQRYAAAIESAAIEAEDQESSPDMASGDEDEEPDEE
jgi:hypothetical protein